VSVSVIMFPGHGARTPSEVGDGLLIPLPDPTGLAGHPAALTLIDRRMGLREHRILDDGSEWWTHAHGDAHVTACSCERMGAAHYRIDFWPSRAQVCTARLGHAIGGLIAGILLGFAATPR
jgi:hypothetical protein